MPKSSKKDRPMPVFVGPQQDRTGWRD